MTLSFKDLKGKKILVTGGGGIGVGGGICKVLDRCACTIILNELKPEVAEKAAKNYQHAIPMAADISKEDEVMAMFDKIEKDVGVLDGVVNNAGIGMNKKAHQASRQEFTKLFDVDVKGVWLVSRAFANQMIESNRTGNIVNISSVLAHASWSGYAIYSSAKSAVEGLTRGMAAELGKYHIRVNAVGPGYVHAEQNYELIKSFTDEPEKWVRDVIENCQILPFEIDHEDCGNAVAFLMSDLSRAITGQTLYVDNGVSSLLRNSRYTKNS
ncbi:MAG: SDR family NAD(P)-dependent oxidoreductase [Balneolaceae bacterium]